MYGLLSAAKLGVALGRVGMPLYSLLGAVLQASVMSL